MDELAREGIVGLAAQAAHRHIHHVRVAVEVHVPHLLGDERAGQDLAGPTHQEREQREFLRREIQRLLRARGPAADEIQFEVGQAHDFERSRRAAPQQGAHAREQLGERERLHQIIIRAEFEAAHAIMHGITRGEKQRGGLFTLAAQPTEDGPAILARHHHVEDDQVVGAGLRLVQAIRPVARRIHDESIFGQPFSQELPRLRVVFNDQDAHGEWDSALRDPFNASARQSPPPDAHGTTPQTARG